MSSSNVTGLAHVSIFVQNIARSCLLYQDILEFVPDDEQVNDRMRILLLKKGGATLELIQHTPARELTRTPGPINHIALKVEDMDALVRELRAKGYEFETDDPIEAPDAFGGIKLIFFAGPDGERIELIQSL